MRNVLAWVSILVLAGTSAACSGGDSGGGGSGISGLGFNMKGGKGTAGDGGTGGYFDIDAWGGGDVKVLASGSVNTSVSVPSRLPYLGTHAMDITTDTILDVATTGFHLVAGDTAIYDGTDVVTGIRVRPGVTLTIKPNFPGAGVRDYARLNLSDGLLVEGTIKLAKVDQSAAGDGLGVDTAGLSFNYYELGGLVITSSGKIDLSGADDGAGAGRNGGSLTVWPEAFSSAGVITAKGGNGSTDGGNGGSVEVYTTEGYATSTGSILTDGGNGGAGGYGGSAGSIDFESSWGYGYVLAKGLFSATGGNGATGGGSGNSIYIYTDWGAMIAAGTFRSFGGNATVSGDGGSGDYVEFDSYGDVRVTGIVDTRGGNGAGTGSGGSGGEVYVYAYENEAWGSGYYEPNSGGAYFGASVNANGGEGAYGGSAGGFYLYQDTSGATTVKGVPIQLVGYSKIDLSGGDGSVNGGSAGGDWNYNSNGDAYGNHIYAGYGYDDFSNYFVGSVVNEATFLARGGNGDTGNGGDGASIDFETYYDLYPPYDNGVKSSGSLDVSGGDGAANGGGAGSVYLYGKYFVDVSGTVIASGGKGGTGNGGYAGEIDVYSDASLTCGSLVANGGASASGNGVYGGDIYVSAANTATTNGTVSANGGASTSADGGAGGYIWIMSQDDISHVNGTVSATKGAGGTAADNGEIWIDGMHTSGI